MPTIKKNIECVLKSFVHDSEALKTDGSVLRCRYFEVKWNSSIKFHMQQQSNIKTSEIISY